jgi:leucyl aminopeptidase (aminopeptidase T)
MTAFETLFRLVELERGDRVVIVSDPRSDEEVARAAFSAALEFGVDAVWSSVRPRDRNGDELPDPVRASIGHSDLVLLVTSWSPSHSAGVIEAMAGGARVLSMPGITSDLMARGAASADYAQVKRLTDRFGEHLAAGRTISISTPLGTALEAELGAWTRVPLLDGGPLPRGSGGLGNFPAGEAAISPIEGTTNGRIMVDLTTSTTRAPLSEVIELTVTNGVVVGITGGPEADALRSFLDEAGPSARIVAEIALGTNDLALHVGVVLEDEKKLGTAHVGLGNARAFGGLNESPVHVDVIFDRASASVDGVDLLVDGQVAAEAMRRESIDDMPGTGGHYRRSELPTENRGGQLFVGWPDARGVRIWSQVGDDTTSVAAVEAVASVSAATVEPGTAEARLFNVLERYRVVDAVDPREDARAAVPVGAVEAQA